VIARAAAERGARALGWIAQNVDRLKPSSNRPLAPQLVALGELALLVHLLARSRNPDRAALASCRSALVEMYDEQTFEAASRDDSSAVFNAWLTMLLGLPKEVRRRPPGSDDPNTFARERLPHRTLELCWLFGALEWSSPYLRSIEDVYRSSYLARPHAIANATLADCYAVTHAIAYVTDFGAQRFFDEPAWANVVADGHAILTLALEWGNYDLVAETLAALRWLNAPGDERQEHAWQTLAARQLRSGAVPAVTGRAEFDDALAAAQDVPSLFPFFYHPTLVTAIAALD